MATAAPKSPVTIPAAASPAPRSVPPERSIALRAENPSATAGRPVSPQVTRLSTPNTSDRTARSSFGGT